MTDGYCLEDFVGDQERFFAEYFNKKPLLRRGALGGRIADLPSIEELDDLLALEASPSSALRVTKAGKGVPSGAYTVPRGPGLPGALNAEKVYELFRSGGTVTWNSLNHLLPSTRRLAEAFAQAFACHSEVVLFVTPAGNKGFAPHHDSIDVFVVQVNGTKTWSVWPTPDVRPGGEGSYTPEELGTPALEATLAPGDVLYVPHGTAHAAAANSEMSLHLSVGVEPRRWRDLLAETVEAVLDDDGFHAFPALGDHALPAAADELLAKLQLLTTRLAALDPRERIEWLAARGRRRNGADRPREFRRLWAADTLRPDSPLRRSAVPVQIGTSDGTKTSLAANGHRLAVPDPVAEVVQTLTATGGQVTAAALFPGVDATRSVRTAQALTRIGVLEYADEEAKADTP